MRKDLELASGDGAAAVSSTGAPTAVSPLARERLLELATFGGMLLQFGLLVLVIRAFGIESKAFLKLCVLAFGGFAIHHFLPARMKLAFFALLSIAGIAWILGPRNAAWIVGLGAALVGIAHLPLPMLARMVLLFAAAIGIVELRKLGGDGPVPSVIWPVLGSMFMFRLMVYVYDLKHRAAPFGVWRAMAYFAMLPNLCFPLFPVVDYKKFCSSHYNAPALGIYQQGLTYIARGVVQLLIYRFVYQNLLIDPASIADAGDAARYMVTTYLLYLRISGSFHVIVGLLHLFGFNLSESHHLYLIASSFTDYWRRINIYWKDFIQKLFFNPVFFAASKKTTPIGAMAIATGVAFFFTWILHSYQWYWIRGKFDLTWQDGVFWSFFGFLVLVNVIVEMRRPKKSRLSKPVRTLRSDVMLALGTIGTFVVICSSWTIWTAGSWAELKLVYSNLFRPTWKDVAIWIGALALLGLFAVWLGRQVRTQTEGAASKKALAPSTTWLAGARVAATCGVLLLLANYPKLLAFSPDAAGVVDRLRSANRLNRGDAQALERGYYEDLVDVTRFNPELAQLYMDQPPDWSKNRAIHQTGSYPPYELIPSTSVQYKGATYTTNSFGLRDREYALAKPAGTYRLAILGASHAGGSGVADNDTYENVVEDRLNARDTTAERAHYEILNFSVGGYGPLCRLAVLEKSVFQFSPDAVIYEGINDFTWIANEVGHAAAEKIPIPFEHVNEIARAVGVEGGTPSVVAEQRISPRSEELLEWAYTRFVEQCRSHGARPIAIFVPRPEDRSNEQADFDRQLAIARRSGFTVIDMSGAYDSLRDMESIWIAKWDRHPNASGHKLLADKLYSGLLEELAKPWPR